MVDYSKWKNIEVSDDEDETHPNIDTPSLFRWRHRARLERMEEMKREADEIERKRNEALARRTQIEQKLADKTSACTDVKDLRKELETVEKEIAEVQELAAQHEKKEKMAPWNVDTISQPGFAKTIINKKPLKQDDEELSAEQKEKKMQEFFQTYEKELKHFGMLKRFDDSKAYLKSHPHLVCEDTPNYLVVWCINLEMDGKHDLMEHVAHQTICMQFLLELAKQLEYDPRACVDSFFSKIQVAEPVYKQSFDDELRLFKERIRKRAAEKLEEAIQEAEEEERQNRLGPGGLDPVEVFESLPDELKRCFESQDVKMLQDTICTMDEEAARYHMKRCVDSGLWLPDANKDKNNAETENDGKGDTETSNLKESSATTSTP